MQAFLLNYPLWAALWAITLAQVIKIPLYFLATRKWGYHLLFSTGGMPSSHSGAVTALATAFGIKEGFGSNWFAISLILAVIVMFDAAGIRRHAGNHAIILNRLMDEFNHLFEGFKTFKDKSSTEQQQHLKELLGHKPIEVFGGAILGIVVAIVLSYIY